MHDPSVSFSLFLVLPAYFFSSCLCWLRSLLFAAGSPVPHFNSPPFGVPVDLLVPLLFVGPLFLRSIQVPPCSLRSVLPSRRHFSAAAIFPYATLLSFKCLPVPKHARRFYRFPGRLDRPSSTPFTRMVKYFPPLTPLALQVLRAWSDYPPQHTFVTRLRQLDSARTYFFLQKREFIGDFT